MRPSPVDKRAWTLQEQLASKRILHYGAGAIFWECLTLNASEFDPEARTNLNGSGPGLAERRRAQKRIMQGLSEENGQKSIWHAETDCYAQWTQLMTEYTARDLSKMTDRIPASLGISNMVGARLNDKTTAGIWSGPHCLLSLLWVVQCPETSSRNANYPTWSWASIMGSVSFCYGQSRHLQELHFEPSRFEIVTQRSNDSQSHVVASMELTSTVKRFAASERLWTRCAMVYEIVMGSIGQRLDHLKNGRTPHKPDFVRRSKDLPGGETELYCLVMARFPAQPLARAQPGVFYADGGARKSSVLCLCLEPTTDVSADGQVTQFRRTGICEFWECDDFWEDTIRDFPVSIV